MKKNKSFFQEIFLKIQIETSVLNNKKKTNSDNIQGGFFIILFFLRCTLYLFLNLFTISLLYNSYIYFTSICFASYIKVFLKTFGLISTYMYHYDPNPYISHFFMLELYFAGF